MNSKLIQAAEAKYGILFKTFIFFSLINPIFEAKKMR